MRRAHHERKVSEGNALLLFAAGAISGAAAGVYFVRRFGTREALLRAIRDRLYQLREYWEAADDWVDAEERRERDVVDAYERDESYEDAPETSSRHAGADAMPSLVHEDDIRGPADVSTPVADRSQEHQLEERVLDAFEADAVLRERAVSIAATGPDVVELTGWVRSLDEASRAASVARQVDGVSMVVNRVAIRASGATARGSAETDAGTDVAPEASG